MVRGTELFIANKKILKAKAAVLLSRVDGPHDMLSTLQKAIKQAETNKCDLNDLPTDHGTVVSRLETALVDAKAFQENVGGCKISSIAALVSKHDELDDVFDTLYCIWKDLFAGLQRKIADGVSNIRSENSRDHWQGAKIQGHFMKMGSGEGQSKNLGHSIAAYNKLALDGNAPTWLQYVNAFVAVNPNETEFDLRKPAVFYKVSDAEVPEAVAFFEKHLSDITDKMDRLKVQMDERPNWIGSNGVVEVHVEVDGFKIFREGVDEHQDAKPVSVVFRNNSRRQGSVAISFSPMSSLIHCTDCGGQPIFFQIMPTDEFLKMGVTMDALDAFLDGNKGDAWLAKHSVTIPLLHEQVIYIPSGYTTFVARHEVAAQRTQLLFGLSSVTVLPPKSNFLSRNGEISEAAMTVVKQNNIDAMEAKALRSTMYKDRLAFF